MLTTETYVIDEALEELSDRIETLEDLLEDLEQGTDQHEAITARRDRVGYLQDGLRWQRDEEGWPGDAEIELGALTAGEKAIMHREAPNSADPEEMRLWFVAASTESAPYAGGGLEATFNALADCHPAFVEWVEAKTNSLGVPGDSGNRSSTSSSQTETEASPTSRDEPDSTTTSSSDSPTA